jgi:cytochrome bd-type quinol oxidase subunit 2
MNLKRATWMSVLLYISSAIIGILLAGFLNIDVENTNEIPISLWYWGISATIVLLIFFTRWYFKDTKISRNAKEGFLFGAAAILIGTIIDAIIVIPYIIINQNSAEVLAYYLSPLFWITLLVILAVSSAVGWHLGNLKDTKKRLPQNKDTSKKLINPTKSLKKYMKKKK